MKGLGRKFSAQASELYSWKYLDKPALINVFPEIDYKHAKVLDLGCGSGRGFELFDGAIIKQSKMYGFDIDSGLLLTAKEKYPTVNFMKYDLRKWPAQKYKGVFSIIYSIHVLHYFNRKELSTIFSKVFVALEPNGYIVFIVPHPMRWIDDLRDYFKRGYKNITATWNTKLKQHLSTLEDYTETLHENGFMILRIVEPVPIAEGRVDLKNFKKYSREPMRLLVVAIKNDS